MNPIIPTKNNKKSIENGKINIDKKISDKSIFRIVGRYTKLSEIFFQKLRVSRNLSSI